MRVPTYLQKENYKIVKEEDFLTVTIMNEEENGRDNEFFEIYYFGELFLDTMICGIFDDKTCKTVPCKIIAKCIKTGKEILLFDEAMNSIWTSYQKELLPNLIFRCQKSGLSSVTV